MTTLRLLLILIGILGCEKIFANNLDMYGARPFISATQNLNERWDANLFYSETLNLADEMRNGQRYPAKDLQSYFQGGFIYRYLPNINFAFGFVFQKSNPFSESYLNENRLWQQVIYIQPWFSGNLSHRLRFEERFIQDKARHGTRPLATRLRYQLAFTAPFIGTTIASKSWFYSVYNEFYFSTSGDRNAFYSEDWIFGGVGYQTSQWGRIEFGPLLQYAYINKNKDSRSLMLAQIGWSLNF